MKKCKKENCLTRMSDSSPLYCPEHNSSNTYIEELRKRIEKHFHGYISLGKEQNGMNRGEILAKPEMLESFIVKELTSALEEQENKRLNHMRFVMYHWSGTGKAMIDDYIEEYLDKDIDSLSDNNKSNEQRK